MDQPQAAGVDWDERVVKAGRRAVLAHLLELPLGGLQLEDTGEPYFGEQNARQVRWPPGRPPRQRAGTRLRFGRCCCQPAGCRHHPATQDAAPRSRSVGACSGGPYTLTGCPLALPPAQPAQRAMREETVERVMGVIVPALGLGGAAAEAQAARRRLRWLYSGAAKSLSPLCYTDKVRCGLLGRATWTARFSSARSGTNPHHASQALQLTARFHSQLSVLVPPPEEERVGQAAGGADPLCSWNGDAVELIMEHLIPFDYSLRQHVKIVQGLCELAFTCEAVEMARVADVLYEAVKVGARGVEGGWKATRLPTCRLLVC